MGYTLRNGHRLYDICHFLRPTYLLVPLAGREERACCFSTTGLMICSSFFQLQNSALSVWAVFGRSGLHFITQANNVKLFRLFSLYFFPQHFTNVPQSFGDTEIDTQSIPRENVPVRIRFFFPWLDYTEVMGSTWDVTFRVCSLDMLIVCCLSQSVWIENLQLAHTRHCTVHLWTVSHIALWTKALIKLD